MKNFQSGLHALRLFPAAQTFANTQKLSSLALGAAGGQWLNKPTDKLVN
jgi:hypothetical protein